MTLSDFGALVAASSQPVILLEGRRSISSSDFRIARTAARLLTETFPQALFRSGNADGSDQAFADGVASVDPCRLQVVAPYESHRKKFRKSGAHYDSPESLDRLQEDEVALQSILASPHNRRLIEQRKTVGVLGAKARYLLRDTMKVLGHSAEFPPPVAALFYVDLENPDSGGTGHTIRVCRQQGIPHAFQNEWGTWFE